MVFALNNYEEYAAAALENYKKRDAASRFLLVEAVKALKIGRVLDVGCGAGQELLPFLERTEAVCFGIDAAPELGSVSKTVFGNQFAGKANFVVSKGEELPFESESFDLVLCSVALPYMHNKTAIAEIARVLRKNGVFLLKIHAPAFYFRLFFERLKTFHPKQIAYPLICFAAGLFHHLTGKQLSEGIWKRKEIYQTRKLLEKEFSRHNLSIIRELPDSNLQTPSFFVVKL